MSESGPTAAHWRERSGLLQPGELNYPEHLPIVGAREQVLRALHDHQVVVVAGETGSGKTTQLPKMCLELGLAARGQIGHTQPRRIAARAVAERIAEELGEPLGATGVGRIGYQVRFTDRSSQATQVKVMTDGILLNELQRDKDLRRYSVLIVDEAHERSLNIDFILGYLKALLPRRPELKVVVTSATIDPQRFARHFATDSQGQVIREVPIIEVSGRTFPVQIRYRPVGAVTEVAPAVIVELDQVGAVVEAVQELWTEPPARLDASDILVFFSGEREIRDAAQALRGLHLPGTEILPLFARLSAAEQHRVFHRGAARRVILATNVAETSLTVPGVGFVVDTGTARISRYSKRTKVQRLPIEPISKASATQRSGRCGRVGPGVCIRLYSAHDFEARRDFTEPEILRTSLAAVILQMTALGLGEIGRFPFIDPPDSRQIADGLRLLDELGALAHPDARAPAHRRRHTSRPTLTSIGRVLARLPVDPRHGRMLVEAGRRGCLREVLVVAALLSIQDPRERPLGAEAEADSLHKRFADERSDFAGALNLWTYLQEQQKAVSHSAFRRMCQREYLHFLRVREWQDLHSQLRKACRDAGIDSAPAASHGSLDWDGVHQAILSGLLSHVGRRDVETRDYLGARGTRFALSPGSALARKAPDFVMAGDLVETSRLWARTNARIDPDWAVEAGAHVVTRTVSEPRWSRRAGAVVATERVSLFGVTLVADRQIQYSRVDPVVSRELFIRHALVEGDWKPLHEFWAANAATVARIGELEERLRRRDLIVDDDVLFEFFDARVPTEVVSERTFDRWWRAERRRRPQLLHLTEEMLRSEHGGGMATEDYPGSWVQDDLTFEVTYQFSPGVDGDGASVRIPAEVVNQVRADGFDWQVPGLREDLVMALIKSLPKATRRHFVPVQEHARAALALIDADSGRPLTEELSRVLLSVAGVAIKAHDWDISKVPSHLRITFVIIGRAGETMAAGKDLQALRAQVAPALADRLAQAGAGFALDGLTAWPPGEHGIVPEVFEAAVGGRIVRGFPALVDEGRSVALRLFDDPHTAEVAHHNGVRRLLLLTTPSPWKRILATLTTTERLALATAPGGHVASLLEDCRAAALDEFMAEQGPGPIRDRGTFELVVSNVRAHGSRRVGEVVAQVIPILTRADVLRSTLTAASAGSAPTAPFWVSDLQAQLQGLVHPGFVVSSGAWRLHHLRRYLSAMEHRLDRAPRNPRERELHDSVDAVETAYADLLERLPAIARRSGPVREIAWMIEELRVSLFAQSLGTAHKVSEKRVLAAIAACPLAVLPPPDPAESLPSGRR